MSNDGRIYITITDSPVGNSGNGGAGTGGKGQGRVKGIDGVSTKGISQQADLMQHQVYTFLLNETKQAANFAINHIGDFSGDYRAQRQVQRTMQIGSKMLNIGLAFAVSAPLGVISALATGIEYAEQEYANQFAIKKQNYTINRLRDISGLDNLTNGSR